MPLFDNLQSPLKFTGKWQKVQQIKR